MDDCPNNNEPLRREVEIHLHRIDQRHDDDWSGHRLLHEQADSHTNASVVALDKRLDGMNEFRQQLTEQAKTFSTTTEFGAEKVDTRRRFEMLENKINTLERDMGTAMRAEVRPVQDARVGQMAIVSAVVIGISILSVIIVVANYLSTQ
jgi:hypothetical protein